MKSAQAGITSEIWFIAVLIALGLSSPLWAKGPGEELIDACKADIRSLCKDVKPSAGQIIGCLKERRFEVSAECKSALEKKPGSAEQN